MPAAGVVMIVAVALIVLAVVYYLVSTIVALQRITNALDDAITGVVGIIEKSAPVNDVVTSINTNLDAGVDLLEGLLVKKAGIQDAVGLVEGLYPGAAGEGFRNFPESKETKAPRISEVYTKGTLTLARLGREAPIAAASPNGPALRNPSYGSLAARGLYPEARQARPQAMPRSPIIGTDSPVQYEPSESPGIRKHAPGKAAVLEPPQTPEQTPPQGPEQTPPQAPEQTEAQEGHAKSGLAFFRRLKGD